jgi:hypothetical protein
MRKMLAIFTVMFVALFVTAAASSSGGGQWWHHTLNNNTVCNQSDATPNTPDAGPFASKELCEAYTGGGDPPPVVGPVAGWPSSSGTLSGTFTCDPITLTSTDDKNGYGVLDFGAIPGTFATMGDGGSFTYLEGEGAGGSPRLSVFLGNGDLWYIYLYSFNGAPSTPSFELSGTNTYLTYAQAMAIDGTQPVEDAALVVDSGWAQEGGTLTIQVNGVSSSTCGGAPASPPRTDHAYLCYSVGGNPFVSQTEPVNQTQQLLNAGYWYASAVLGNVPGGENMGAYHLVCAAPGTLGLYGNAPPALTYLNFEGDVLSFEYAAKNFFIGAYPIIG